MRKEWKVSFDFKANTFQGLSQVLHMSVGGSGAGRGAKYGDRTPAVWVHSSRGFLISSAVGGRVSYAKYFKPLPSTGEWVNIQVGQEIEESEMTYYIIIDGKKRLSVKNSQPSEFENVKVYSASSWYSPVSGYIRNLQIQNKHDECLLDWAAAFSLPRERSLESSSLLTTLPTLTKDWRVSFELKPENYNYRGYGQVLHMTTGGKSGKIGDRTPALWIHPTRGVVISTTLNGKATVSKMFRSDKPPLNEWTAVEISQTKKGATYTFSLVMRGKTLWSVENTTPTQFSNVHVYASSLWYVAQAGSIRKFKIETMMPGKKH